MCHFLVKRKKHIAGQQTLSALFSNTKRLPVHTTTTITSRCATSKIFPNVFTDLPTVTSTDATALTDVTTLCVCATLTSPDVSPPHIPTEVDAHTYSPTVSVSQTSASTNTSTSSLCS